MINYENIERVIARMIAMREIQFVLSGFALHLASHFGRSRTSMCSTTPGLLSNGRSFSNRSYRYAFSNDHPNCFASYSANSGSFVRYAGQVSETLNPK